MNNQLSAFVQFILIVSSSGTLASSVQPIQLDFNPDDFVPDVVQLPDSAQNTPSDALLESDNGIAGVVPERNYVDEFAPKASKVTVTGTVKRFANSLSGRGSSMSLLQQANGIEVQFWQPTNPNNMVKAITDESGNYSIELSNGFWQGEACESAQGYNPNAWQLNVKNNRLVNLQAVTYSKPTITGQALDAVMQGFDVELYGASTFTKKAGDEIRINGSGFGCNGTLVFEFQNAVDRCGDKIPQVYNHEIIKVKYKDFISSTDNQLILSMPSLKDSVATTEDNSLRIAKMYYQKGALRSNAILVAEFIHDPLVDSTCDGSVIAAANAESNQASSASTQGLVGGVGSNPAPQGGLTQPFGTLFTKKQIARDLDLSIDMNSVSEQIGGY